MREISDLVRQIIKAGADPIEAAAIITEAFAAGAASVTTPPAGTARQERNKRYYEAKRLKPSEKRLNKTDDEASEKASESVLNRLNSDATPRARVDDSSSREVDTGKKNKKETTSIKTLPLPDPFDDFWKTYPNKIGKPEALKSWQRAIRRAAPPEIMAGLKRYIAAKPPERSWCNPSTFLNQDRWADEPAPTNGQTGPPNGGLFYDSGSGWTDRENHEPEPKSPTRTVAPELLPAQIKAMKR